MIVAADGVLRQYNVVEWKARVYDIVNVVLVFVVLCYHVAIDTVPLSPILWGVRELPHRRRGNQVATQHLSPTKVVQTKWEHLISQVTAQFLCNETTTG